MMRGGGPQRSEDVFAWVGLVLVSHGMFVSSWCAWTSVTETLPRLKDGLTKNDIYIKDGMYYFRRKVESHTMEVEDATRVEAKAAWQHHACFVHPHILTTTPPHLPIFSEQAHVAILVG